MDLVLTELLLYSLNMQRAHQTSPKHISYMQLCKLSLLIHSVIHPCITQYSLMHSFAILEAVRALCRLCRQTMGTAAPSWPVHRPHTTRSPRAQAPWKCAHFRGSNSFRMCEQNDTVHHKCHRKPAAYYKRKKNQVLTSSIWLELQQEHWW